jgi:hypothetical protein
LNWEEPIASQNPMQIVSNQAGAQNQFGDHEVCLWSAASFNNDQYSQATLVNIGSWSG